MIKPEQLKLQTPLAQTSLYKWGTGTARHFLSYYRKLWI
jgi:hypothetical protein